MRPHSITALSSATVSCAHQPPSIPFAFAGQGISGLTPTHLAVWERMVRLYRACPLDTTAEVCEAAVADADVVQESAPERLELKQQLWAAIEAAAKPDALFASSSSALPASAITERIQRYRRLRAVAA